MIFSLSKKHCASAPPKTEMPAFSSKTVPEGVLTEYYGNRHMDIRQGGYVFYFYIGPHQYGDAGAAEWDLSFPNTEEAHFLCPKGTVGTFTQTSTS